MYFICTKKPPPITSSPQCKYQITKWVRYPGNFGIYYPAPVTEHTAVPASRLIRTKL
ncbi:hypothetical protein M0657_001770 [Pyricularia oryzae]|uniref:Uncharacterized protein n=2 Tax=Pyricularia oryzae TaxID=318829 RepID=A0AA97NS72_PYRO3|nr:hypothetical protein OOU_Y34scaffold00712g19 [Pyricularia oryzae Y34]KAI7930171.1 hypothetical protein M9X92_000946 [Pyricularia oryzae]KAI7930301.1 hypothetical protein M0657_001770 [Pyricularia oryzae]